MSPKINVLPPILAAKIAAGEVVERPASVVKELIENSIDAGASSITVTIAEGGHVVIRVADDGCGIAREDAAAAFIRHATSKIASEDDLYAIRTMGFRGEALASIASVARVVMRTRRREDAAGTFIEVTTGAEPLITDDGCQEGTSIEVKDLFYNTPARLKFLRSTEVEFGRCAEVFKKAAFANPGIRMRLIHGVALVIDSPPGRLHDRIADIAGRQTADKLIAVDTPYLKGYISSPELHYATASRIFTYVNGRPVRDKTVTRAVMDGYGTSIDRTRYPFAVVDIVVDPCDVDVNIHPAKTEVRFKDQRAIYDIVKTGVAVSLSRSGIKLAAAAAPHGRETVYPRQGFHDSHTAGEPRLDLTGLPIEQVTQSFESGEDGADGPRLMELDTVGQLWGEFLVAASMSGNGEFYIIDQHGAAERCAYERLKRNFYGATRARTQALLLPERVETTPEERAALNAAMAHIERLGFEVVPFGLSTKLGGETFLVKAVPEILAGRSAARLIKDLAAELSDVGASGALEERIDAALMRIACHSVIRGPRPLTRDEGNALLRSLAEVDLAGYCPHGRPVIKRFSRREVEAMFKR